MTSSWRALFVGSIIPPSGEHHDRNSTVNCGENAGLRPRISLLGHQDSRGQYRGGQMTRFVLVHGAFSGAWIWGPLMDRLKAAGHSVEAFDLPGLGDDCTPASEITLDGCAARLCDVLQRNSEPAVVVGNSMGGIIATQGAARRRDRVAALVYVAAFIPKDGQSLLDLTR